MPSPSPPRVAYACMEFALHDDLPQYSGGLGVLAGDVLRAAADARAPMAGIGLFWDEGYAIQAIGEDGWPQDSWRKSTRDRLRTLDATVSVRVRGRDVALLAHVIEHESHAPCYVLEPRDEEDRWITRRLYQGGPGDRVAQEIVLGVGGVRLMRALGHEIQRWHLNEGHAVFAGFELLREHVERGLDLQSALQRVRAELVFTTHTPVMAGNEAHDVNLLLEQGADLGVLTRQDLVDLAGDPFNMTEAGLRLAGRANAVSALHAGTARSMWSHVPDAAPIGSITNGVHVPTWADPRMEQALASGGDPWAVHQELKRELVEVVEQRTGTRFAEDRLLLGFARRAATYKRAGLLFSDLERVAPLMEAGRMQVVFAGLAHPDNFEGKGVVAHLVEMSRRFRGAVAFVPGYDMALGRALTRGCDVWLNTPQRPLEASGTSGMKAALNGVLNASVLDGWWAEGCEHGINGWQFGDGYEGPGQDEHDLRALLALLEQEILPTYAEDRARWISMMRQAARSARERFSASRMLDDYRDKLYVPIG